MNTADQISRNQLETHNNMNTDKTTTTASAPVKRATFGQSWIGCVIDNSSFSEDDCNQETIDFARSYGFDPGEMPEHDCEDYSQILSETADDAVSFLNEQDTLPYCSFYFEDNSLFYSPSIESAEEDVEFKSSRENEYPPDDYQGEWMHVSDHGNATLYVRDDKANDTEIWGIV